MAATVMPKTIQVTYERKVNLGNYNSVTFGGTVWADIVHDLSNNPKEAVSVTEQAFRELQESMRELVKIEAMKLWTTIARSRATNGMTPVQMEKEGIDPKLALCYLAEHVGMFDEEGEPIPPIDNPA